MLGGRKGCYVREEIRERTRESFLFYFGICLSQFGRLVICFVLFAGRGVGGNGWNEGRHFGRRLLFRGMGEKLIFILKFC